MKWFGVEKVEEGGPKVHGQGGEKERPLMELEIKERKERKVS